MTTHISRRRKAKSRQAIEPAVQFMCGDKVMLMQKGKSVGTGTVTEGSNLHGRAIPQGYVKIIIEYIQPNTAPVFASSLILMMKKCSQLDNSQHGQQIT